MMMMIISSIIAFYVLTETAANVTLRVASVFARLFVLFSFSDQNITSKHFFTKLAVTVNDVSWHRINLKTEQQLFARTGRKPLPYLIKGFEYKQR